MNPSDFREKTPYSSVFDSVQMECAAKNVMTYLAKTGDTWRPLTWEEYRDGAAKDGHTKVGYEFDYFSRVQPYTESEAAARTFSPCWAEIQ